ncbi:MAG TPA: hypothetical protein VKH37_03195, partial [Ferruginibacter sp.]|nr:hypothetical protein [Ferruginibacter sp.]
MAHHQLPGRRNFIANSVKGSIAVGIGMSTAASLLDSCSPAMHVGTTMTATGFDQKPLPYKYDALENVVDTMTMELHYSKHAAAYSKNLKEAATAEGVNMNAPFENVLARISKYSAKMRNNGGGHYNHEMFWQCMRPKQSNNGPTGSVQAAIGKAFGS